MKGKEEGGGEVNEVTCILMITCLSPKFDVNLVADKAYTCCCGGNFNLCSKVCCVFCSTFLQLSLYLEQMTSSCAPLLLSIPVPKSNEASNNNNAGGNDDACNDNTI